MVSVLLRLYFVVLVSHSVPSLCLCYIFSVLFPPPVPQFMPLCYTSCFTFVIVFCFASFVLLGLITPSCALLLCLIPSLSLGVYKPCVFLCSVLRHALIMLCVSLRLSSHSQVYSFWFVF